MHEGDNPSLSIEFTKNTLFLTVLFISVFQAITEVHSYRAVETLSDLKFIPSLF
jgi:hypothetical protein